MRLLTKNYIGRLLGVGEEVEGTVKSICCQSVPQPRLGSNIFEATDLYYYRRSNHLGSLINSVSHRMEMSGTRGWNWFAVRLHCFRMYSTGSAFRFF